MCARVYARERTRLRERSCVRAILCACLSVCLRACVHDLRIEAVVSARGVAESVGEDRINLRVTQRCSDGSARRMHGATRRSTLQRGAAGCSPAPAHCNTGGEAPNLVHVR